MSALLVNLLGLALLVLIVWWFWFSKPRAIQSDSDVVEIRVADGVYTPARIRLKKGRPVTLRFRREDASPCAEKVVFDDFQLTRDLPLHEPVDITLTPDRGGEFAFTCQMQMYRGTLVVED